MQMSLILVQVLMPQLNQIKLVLVQEISILEMLEVLKKKTKITKSHKHQDLILEVSVTVNLKNKLKQHNHKNKKIQEVI